MHSISQEITNSFPESMKQQYLDLDGVLSEVVLLDIKKPLTRSQLRTLDFVAEYEVGDFRLRNRDHAQDNGSFSKLKVAIMEGGKTKKTKSKEGDIL